ncbi:MULTISPECIES: hypothetical protein [unclassified Streptomyces]|uniref:hypothetical protein n=1 Tax=unclassified Streptomyces TaxID=2593676 RepID=UPI0038665B32
MLLSTLRWRTRAYTARAYDEQVDYVLHVKDQVLTPAQVAAKVAAYRSAGTTFEDTVPSG